MRYLAFTTDMHRQILQTKYQQALDAAKSTAFGKSIRDYDVSETVCTDHVFMNGYTMPLYVAGEVLVDSKRTGSLQRRR